jgi:hypothetical protein
MKPILEYQERSDKLSIIRVYKTMEVCQYKVTYTAKKDETTELARFAYERDLILYLADRLEKK